MRTRGLHEVCTRLSKLPGLGADTRPSLYHRLFYQNRPFTARIGTHGTRFKVVRRTFATIKGPVDW